MKNLRKISKYFAVTFAIVLVCGFAGLVLKEMEKGTFYDLSTKDALSYCAQLELGVFTTSIPYSLSIATFLTFWAMNSGKWTDFFRTLAIGLALVLPLSAMTYYYDWFTRPQILAKSAEQHLEMKNTYPQSLANEFNIDKQQILNGLPMTMHKTKLTARIDSLGTSFRSDADTCGLLLSSLPDTLASEAYKTYHLKEMGIAYQYATHPVADKESLMVIQEVELYQRATQSCDTLRKWQRHRKEYSDRNLNTTCAVVGYLLFAFIGYLLRYKPLKNILMTLAMLIVAVYIYREISTIAQTCAQKVNTVSKQMLEETYEEIKEVRKKEVNTENDSLSSANGD